MSAITESYIQAEFALAAYSSLTPAISGKPYTDALEGNGKGMSFAQATAFAAKWNVITQYTDSGTGLSATVFQEVATGKRYLAIRGTEGVLDFVADYFILNGVPSSLNPQYQSLKTQVQAWLADPAVLQGQNFTVAGHSLGGYLAAGLVADFSANISHAYLYNAPGNNSLISYVSQALGFSSTPDASKITSLRADAGISPVSTLGNDFSPPISIAIENQFLSDVPSPPLSLNHSQRVLTDALAVYAIFSELAPTLSVSDMTALLKASSSQNVATLESAAYALAKLFMPGTSIITAENREALYTTLQSLQQNTLFKQDSGLVQVKLLGASASSTVSGAQTDIAYRYALMQLNPFVVTGDSALYGVHNTGGQLDLYDETTGTGSLTKLYLQDRAAMLGWLNKTYTEDTDIGRVYDGNAWYFKDEASGKDVWVGNPISVKSDPLLRTVLFGQSVSDILTGGGSADHLYGGGGDDIVKGADGNDYLEGGLGSDDLQGGAGRDTLHGGQGADVLEGGKGNDTLNGGAGYDLYIINAGDGFDTVLDADGSGVIKFGTVEAKGNVGVITAKWKQFGSSIWQDQQNGITYGLLNLPDGSQNLLIKDLNGSTVEVKGWSAGELGIVLGAGAPPTPPTPTLTYTGDQSAPLNGDGAYNWGATSWAADGTLVGGIVEANFNDVIYGSAGADLINGLGGNDALDGGAGEDIIDGGLGNDLIGGGAGSDLIYGGAGNDVIHSATGLAAPQRDKPADVWNPPAGRTVWIAGSTWGVYQTTGGNYTIFGGGSIFQNDAPDIVYAGDGDDRVTGGLGMDTLYGELGNDTLWGHGGDDVIEGGDGDDYLEGDGTTDPGFYQTTLEALHGNDILIGGAGRDTLLGGGKDDLLLGGSEDDYLDGGNGNDYLDGGTQNDSLLGEAGDDFLQGGSGDDVLSGGAGNDILDGGAGVDYLEGGAGDDTYLNVTGEDTLFDNQGNNTIQLATATGLGATALATSTFTNSDGGTSLQLDIPLDNGETLKIESAFFGNESTIQFANGDALDLETLVGENLATPLDLTNGDGGGKLYGGAGDDSLRGGAGNDILIGHKGNDTLLGGLGTDTLDGGAGNDTLEGGAGVDYMQGGAGDDTYLITGDDTVFDIEGNNTIVLATANGLSADSLVATVRTGNDGGQYMELAMTLDDGSVLKLDNPFFASGSNTLQFANGDVLDLETLVGEQLATPLNLLLDDAGGRVYGGAGNDVLDGGIGDDTLAGHNGDDTLTGNLGADKLDGGAGNNTLEGGAGDDTYRVGAGNDLIIDTGPGNRLELVGLAAIKNVSLQTDALGRQNLALTFADGATATIRNGFLGAVDTFAAGGTDLNIAAFLDAHVGQNLALQGSFYADRITGGAGNDLINGYAGDDALDGGRGNDQLYGGDGADILRGGVGNDRLAGGGGADKYMFSRGDGADTIVSTTAAEAAGDEVQLGADISSGDLLFYRLADGSLLTRIDATQDSLRFEGWFTQGASVTGLRLNDTTLLDASEMSARAVEAYGGTTGDDVLEGTNADDHVLGYTGNDILRGGAGNDVLEGGDGMDAYRFGWTSLGNDVAVEVSAGASIIALTDGTTLADLKHEQLGSDLMLSFQGGGATLTLKDYFTSVHDWTIQDESGVTTGVADWLALPDPAVDLARVQAEFVDAARAQWAADLLGTYDSFYGKYVRLGADAYRAELVSEYETKIITQQFTLVDYVADDAIIKRQSESASYSSSMIDLLSGPPPVSLPGDTLTGLNFISIDEWTLRLGELGVSGMSLEGLIPVYGNGGGGLVGFLVDHRATPAPDALAQHWQTTTTINTHLERIQGGDSDNIIQGYRYIQYSDEVSMIDGGGGNDTLYISGIPGLNNEVPYFTDTETRIGGYAYGSTGDDMLYGGYYRDTLVGGDGTDLLDGRFSQDTYVMFAGESGTDTIWDTGTQLEQWAHYLLTGYTVVSQPSSVPQPIAGDILRLVGINQADITFSWDQRAVEGLRSVMFSDTAFISFPGLLSPNSALSTVTMHAMLSLSWVGGGVNIVLPNSTDLAGMGLERVQFGDGTVMSMAELVALAPPVPTLNPQELDNVISGQLARNVIYGEGGNDTLYGGIDSDILNGGLGADALFGGAGDDTYIVDSAADAITENLNDGIDSVQSSATYTLSDNVESLILVGEGVIDGTGNTLDNILTGNNAANVLMGEAGNDHLDGSLGNDTLLGGPGNDTYIFTRDSGQDTINSYDTAFGKIDTIKIDGYINPSEVLVSRVGNDLVLSIAGTTDTLTIYQYLANDGVTPYSVEQIMFYDGTIWDLDIVKTKLPDNQSPQVSSPLLDQIGTEGDTFNFTVPAITFSDPDTGDVLAYSATLADGTALPTWLNFNAATRTFSGTPSNADLGSLNITVTATDTGGLSVSDNFAVTVASASYTVVNGSNGIDTLDGSASNDRLNGFAGDDIINGHAGNDIIEGGGGRDTLSGGLGNDTFLVNGDNGADVVNGGDGIDQVLGSNADDSIGFWGYGGDNSVERIDGGAGVNCIVSRKPYSQMDFSSTELVNIARIEGNATDDIIIGSWGDDVIEGGGGRDTLSGGLGNDTFLVNGDSGADVVNGGDGIDQVLGSNADDSIGFWGYGGDNSVERIDGGAGVNRIVSRKSWSQMDFSSTELVNIARIEGNATDDIIIGSWGDDIIEGGGGRDTLSGGLGNDTYILGRGAGTDIIVENDSTPGNTDIAQFLTGVAADQVWFQHIGNNLEASIIGTADKLVVKDWYLGNDRHIEQFKTADGALTLLDSQVDNLVNAMASFAPPAAGQTTLPPDYQANLAQVIAANWQ